MFQSCCLSCFCFCVCCHIVHDVVYLKSDHVSLHIPSHLAPEHQFMLRQVPVKVDGIIIRYRNDLCHMMVHTNVYVVAIGTV